MPAAATGHLLGQQSTDAAVTRVTHILTDMVATPQGSVHEDTGVVTDKLTCKMDSGKAIHSTVFTVLKKKKKGKTVH